VNTPNINRILRQDMRSMKRGAPMGDSSWHDGDAPLYLQRVRFIDGDYGPDGTYWGGGREAKAIWCAFSGECSEHLAAQQSRIYVRAMNRKNAAVEVRLQFPTATFHKE